jgi:hypothetical protein
MKILVSMYLLVLGGLCYGQINYNYYSRSELEQDLDYFSNKLTNIHPVFADKNKLGKWHKKLSSFKGQLKDSSTQNDFYISLASLLATLGDGHSGFVMPTDQRVQFTKAGGKAFPFFVEINNYSIVNSFYCGNDSSLFHGGEEILSINGIECAQMVRDMQKLFGGKSISNKQKAVAQKFRFYIWMFYGFEEDYEIVFKDALGNVDEIKVNGVSSQEFTKNVKRKPKETNEALLLTIDNENETAIVKIKSFADLDGFCSFAGNAFSEIHKNNIKSLIIDVRGNGGGRSVVVDSLMGYLTGEKYSQYKTIETRISNELVERYKEKYPERMDWLNRYSINELVAESPAPEKPANNALRFTGDLYLLANKTSFSAAATFAGVFKELQLGEIIGEETGGTIAYYGDYWFMQTPNTALGFYIAPKRFVQYGGNDLDKGVAPNHWVEDIGDSVLNAAYALIKQKKANSIHK